MNIEAILKNNPGITNTLLEIPNNPDVPFPVLSAKIKITYRCNLKCAMCNIWRKRFCENSSPVSLNKNKIFEILKKLKESGLQKVHFSGGELLMHPDFESIISFALNLNLQVNLTTNGTLITKETAKFLVDSRVHTIAISIDSFSAEEHDRIRGVKGAFKSAWKGINLIRQRKEIKNRKTIIAVNTVVNRKNIGNLDKLYKLLNENKIDSWRILPIDTEIKKLRPRKDQWDTLIKKLPEWQNIVERNPLDWSSERSGIRAESGKFAGVFYGHNLCFAPWFNIFTDADGKIYPCCSGKQSMIPYGNINNENLTDILNGESRKAICASMAAGHIFPACEACDDFLAENKFLNRLLLK